jgi:hypothetical protein
MNNFKSATDLHAKTGSSLEITSALKDILLLLKHEIDSAVENNKNSVVFRLPSEFLIQKLPPNRSKIMVYGKLIKFLEDKGYNCQLKNINKEKAAISNIEMGNYILVKWNTDLYDDLVYDELEDLVASRTID